MIAPAHLHAGNIDLNGGLGRLYGTVGFTIDYPRLVVDLEESTRVEANDPYAYSFAETIASRLGVGGFRVVVKEGFPPLVGLGYTTTLGLSIGVGVSRLYGLEYSIEDIALAIKRGLLTALGLYACKYGGFIVEGGFRKELFEKTVPPLIFRGAIPSNWVFVVAIPNTPRARVSEIRAGEDRILRGVFMSSEEASYLSRVLVVKMLPCFVEGDLKCFGEALTEFNRRLGLVWQKYQGGLYCDPIVEKGVEIMLKKAYAACQSSWGPTFYAVLDDEVKAVELAREIKGFLDSVGGGEVFLTRGRNRGLEVVEIG